MVSSSDTPQLVKAMHHKSEKTKVELPITLQPNSPLLIELEKQGALKLEVLVIVVM